MKEKTRRRREMTERRFFGWKLVYDCGVGVKAEVPSSADIDERKH